MPLIKVRRRVSDDPIEVSRQAKVAMIAPPDEPNSRTLQTTICIVLEKSSNWRFCSDAEATLESFQTHAHHAER